MNLKLNFNFAKSRFKRFQSDTQMRVKESWRKQKGIDCVLRRRFRGTIPQPKIGYGSSKKTRHMNKSGFYRFLVRCPADLECLLMHNGTYEAELAANLSARTRRALVARADQMNIRVINRKARLSTEEAE
jgi:large subunit ribosomal protein L32e